MILPVSVWLVDASKKEHALIRWSVARCSFPVDLRIFLTPEEAVTAIQRESAPPRVIITDLKLPGMNGIELLRWIRQSDFAEVPVVVRCASNHKKDICAAYEAGANAYVVKANDLHLIDQNISGIASFFGGVQRACASPETAEEEVLA